MLALMICPNYSRQMDTSLKEKEREEGTNGPEKEKIKRGEREKKRQERKKINLHRIYKTKTLDLLFSKSVQDK